MPILKFDFSEPEPIYDPLSKDIFAYDFHLVSGASTLPFNLNVRLDILGKDEDVVGQFTDQFNVENEDAESQTATNEFVVKRAEPTNDSDKEDSLSNSNILVNIHFEEEEHSAPIVVTLDIDPPILKNTRHVYSFSSRKSSDIILNIEAKDGQVQGEVRRGIEKTVNAIDPLLPTNKDKELTTNLRSDSVKILKQFLDPGTMDFKLKQLTQEIAPKIADKNSSDKEIAEMKIQKTGETELFHFALVVTGVGDGKNKYRLFGRINRDAEI